MLRCPTPRSALAALAVLAPLAALAPTAQAQTGTQTGTPPAATTTTAPGETLLRLSEAGEVSRAPNELRLDLRAEARGTEAAAVQAQVNRAVQGALERAKAVSGVRASTTGYWTNREGPPNRAWVASQRIALRGSDPAPLLELAGALQSQGLALDNMSWTLSREETQAARQQAGKLAIDQLRARAAAVAEQLGMEVAGIRQISLDAPEPPMPRMAMAMRAEARPAPPPAAAPEDVTVTANVTAEVVLRAK
ncbi:SIMPL domain-containing protein [Roseomonas haemaphysalidis]|uniref:SIMPL domain-containing protein n=1 Tax=Roseomonas haemaphysalidis TaxID=2768162 RepID=A0ABS3KWR2_9PROT|nr:SIMPL domain-containing protein [Roseomonas haemaphysalidis]MBO1081410.1 SIMPL domain-containing protein [Roseomonas haemaphysalidis]